MQRAEFCSERELLMNRGIIYQVASDGTLTRMTPGKPANEDEIQHMIASHPEMVTGSDDKLLLIEREFSISDKLDGSGRWSLDHLFVTRDARPVLVEVKQASNTQLRREVVGQLLEYAANAVVHWTRDDIIQSFGRGYESEDAASEALDEFLRQGGSEQEVSDYDLFWQRVEANLRAGELLLVIVADEIPRELARIVEFLNEQMQATVQAVELRWFTSDTGTKTLVPRLIGATERAAGKKLTSDDGAANEYWVTLKQQHPDLVKGSPWKGRSQDFFSLRTGQPKIVIGCRFVGNELKLHAYFDYDGAKTAYQVAERHQSEVQAAFGHQLQWDPMEEYKAARILFSLPDAPMQNRSDWARQHKWLYEHGKALGDALRPILPDIEEALSQGASSGTV
jgi:hypothetical protein